MADEGETSIRPGRAGRPASSVDDFLAQEWASFDLRSRSLRPLSKVQATRDAITLTFDLPFVEKKDIALTSTESTVEITAKMRKPVSLRVGGHVQRSVLFERYSGHFRLPARVEAAKGKATFKNGLLRVRLPIARKGTKVKVA